VRKDFPIWLLVRVDQDGVMATKLVIKESETPKAATKNKVAPAKKAAPTKKASTAVNTSRDTESRIPTTSTLRALAELKDGKLNRYADEDDLFRKLGIKVGKT